jgi:hypothetical protein
MRLFVTAIILALLMGALPAFAQDNTWFYIGQSVGNVRHQDKYGYGSVEVRRLLHTWGKVSLGYGGALDVGTRDDYIGPNLAIFYHISDRWEASLTSGPGWYSNHSLDLGSNLEFRSGVELYLLLNRGWRLDVGVFHYSNAGLHAYNPGAESVRFAVVIPLRF